MKMTDKEIIEQILHGNQNAFEILVSRYQRLVYGLAAHRTRSFEDAKDVAQEVFLQAYLNLGKLKNPEKFASWMRTVFEYSNSNLASAIFFFGTHTIL